MRVKIGATAVAVLIMISAGVAQASLPPGGTFVDDDGSVHEPAIEAIAADGITLGCNPPVNDRFCPSEGVTRGQMAAFLVRALGLTVTLDDPFIDDDGSVFEPSIERLAAAGITMGCNPPANDRFCPNEVVTRGQMAAFLVRALGYGEGGGSDLFVDDDGSVFESAIDRLGTAGVTRGCNPPANDRFCPNQAVTRAEMATFLTRALHLTPVDPPGTPEQVMADFEAYWVAGDWTGMAEVAEPAAVNEAEAWGPVIWVTAYSGCERDDTYCDLLVAWDPNSYALLFGATLGFRNSGELVVQQLVFQGDAG